MTPSLRLLLVLVPALAGCWAPKGVFIPVEAYGAHVPGEYVIGPGDTLQVRVFQQEAMSARVRVRGDGKVSLPLVNDWVVAGKMPTQVAAELQVRLKEFINTPVVTVSLEEMRPLTVSVVGEVVRAGVVTLEPGAGVLHAIAAAGGLTDFAHKDGLFVLRKPGPVDKPVRIRFTWEALTSGDQASVKFLLQPQDVVVAE
ncbi:MAG: polysaccharide biosynthesis/export family protein [Myxococcus sp.]|nr:polysaccharide biosynthesis/export family protein [Myxococcus sp.]